MPLSAPTDTPRQRWLFSVPIASLIPPWSHFAACHSCLQVHNPTVNMPLEGYVHTLTYHCTPSTWQQLADRKCSGNICRKKERRSGRRERMRGEGLKDRNHFSCTSAHVQKCSSCMRTVICPFLSPTQLIKYILSACCVPDGERTSPHDSCLRSPTWAAQHKAFNSTLVTVSQHYLVNKVSSVDRETFEGWWESSLGKMNFDVTDSSPKMAQGNIPLSDSLVIFRYNLSFLFTNYIDLSWGKDWYCEYITCFKTHLFVNGTVAWCLQRFADVAAWEYLPFGRFYRI